MPKAIVTGSKGFVGGYLAQELSENGWEVRVFNLRDGQDVRDYEFVRNALDIERPDAVFHLAAQAFVAESFSNPVRAFEVNTIGSVNILEAVRQLGIKTKVLLAGTSEEYGSGANGETNTLRPQSPYAISKLAMDCMGQLYSKSYGMPVVVTRAFNHTGPGRGEMYAESAFAKQIAEIEAGKRKVLKHGYLDPVRNYTDVRDVVRAYRLAVDAEPGVYNICSKRNVTMQWVLDTLNNFSEYKIPTELSGTLLRPVDFSFQEPSFDRFYKQTKWMPQIELELTLKDLLNYWRKHV